MKSPIVFKITSYLHKMSVLLYSDLIIYYDIYQWSYKF